MSICEIFISLPWCCGDKNCEQQWHEANYWIDGDEYTVDRFGDGDHDLIDKEDIPDDDEYHAAWLEYIQFIATTGKDPLGEYCRVKRTKAVRERWDFRWEPLSVGPILTEMRHAGRMYPRDDLPEYVSKYFTLTSKGNIIASFKGRCDELAEQHKPWVWCTVYISRKIPRKEKTIERELKRVARRELKRLKNAHPDKGHLKIE